MPKRFEDIIGRTHKETLKMTRENPAPSPQQLRIIVSELFQRVTCVDHQRAVVRLFYILQNLV